MLCRYVSTTGQVLRKIWELVEMLQTFFCRHSLLLPQRIWLAFAAGSSATIYSVSSLFSSGNPKLCLQYIIMYSTRHLQLMVNFRGKPFKLTTWKVFSELFVVVVRLLLLLLLPQLDSLSLSVRVSSFMVYLPVTLHIFVHVPTNYIVHTSPPW